MSQALEAKIKFTKTQNLCHSPNLDPLNLPAIWHEVNGFTRYLYYKQFIDPSSLQVIIPQQLGCLLFVPHQISDNNQEILHLLRESFGHSLADSDVDRHESYLLIVGRGVLDSLPDWLGQTVHLNPPAETILGVNEMQVRIVQYI